MSATDRTSRRRGPRLLVESLESRLVMTGGAGSLFATIPSAISTPGGTVEVPFTVRPDLFTRPHGGLVLGVDVSAQSGSTVQPVIVSLDNAQGHVLGRASHATYDPKLSAQLAGKVHTSAAIVTIPGPPHPGQPANYSIRVSGDNQTKGALTVGFYLPGDTNGDGVVNQADLQAIRAAMGTRFGDPKFSLDADANRDGRIDRTDLAIARRDLGVKTTILPTITAKNDPSIVIDPRTRTTTSGDIPITGTATSGATITLDETQNRVPEVKATADANGQYHLTVHLAPGSNAFTLASADGFGQKIAGIIPTIKYVPASS